jgi:hypothetical protein
MSEMRRYYLGVCAGGALEGALVVISLISRFNTGNEHRDAPIPKNKVAQASCFTTCQIAFLPCPCSLRECLCIHQPHETRREPKLRFRVGGLPKRLSIVEEWVISFPLSATTAGYGGIIQPTLCRPASCLL